MHLLEAEPNTGQERPQNQPWELKEKPGLSFEIYKCHISLSDPPGPVILNWGPLAAPVGNVSCHSWRGAATGREGGGQGCYSTSCYAPDHASHRGHPALGPQFHCLLPNWARRVPPTPTPLASLGVIHFAPPLQAASDPQVTNPPTPQPPSSWWVRK